MNELDGNAEPCGAPFVTRLKSTALVYAATLQAGKVAAPAFATRFCSSGGTFLKGAGESLLIRYAVLPIDPRASEPGRLSNGNRRAYKVPTGTASSVRTSLRLVVLHAVAGRRSCPHAAHWVPARMPGAGEMHNAVRSSSRLWPPAAPAVNQPPPGVFARRGFQAARAIADR